LVEDLTTVVVRLETVYASALYTQSRKLPSAFLRALQQKLRPGVDQQMRFPLLVSMHTFAIVSLDCARRTVDGRIDGPSPCLVIAVHLERPVEDTARLPSGDILDDICATLAGNKAKICLMNTLDVLLIRGVRVRVPKVVMRHLHRG
jgi:hypothetical protein